MKLLILAGPYEGDRIRRAAVAAGCEAVTVEPGENLSGWIQASRPDVIILAPQMAAADPAVALTRIRAVPRGRVPILLLGDAEEEDRLRPLAEGFFLRPADVPTLLARAREVAGRPGEGDGSGPKVQGVGAGARGADDSGPNGGRAGRQGADEANPGGENAAAPRALKPLVPSADSARALGPGPGGGGVPGSAPAVAATGTSGDGGGEQTFAASPWSGSGTPGRSVAAGAPLRPLASRGWMERLGERIEAEFDADIQDVVRAVGSLREATDGGGGLAAAGGVETLVAGSPSSADEDANDTVFSEEAAAAVAELKDESSQKTLEVPQLGPDEEPAADAESPADSARARIARVAESGGVAAEETDLDLPTLLGRVYLSRLSGRMTIRAGEARKFIVFERGHPVMAGSNRVEDRMGAMLLREGRFSPEQLATCAAEVASSGRKLGAILIDRGLLKPVELGPIVRRHYEEIIYSLFPWDHGAWTLGADKSTANEKVLLSRHPAALILEGIRRRYDDQRALAGLGGPDQILRLRATTGTADLLDRMGVTSEERGLALLLDGVRTLGQLTGLRGDNGNGNGGVSNNSDTGAGGEPDGGNGATTTVRPRSARPGLLGLAWALFALERLELVERPELAGAGAEFGASASRVVDDARDEAIDRARVQARYALVTEGDYFQILGVPRDANAHEIARAFQLLSEELAPEALHAKVAAELDAELVEIHGVLAEAARLLADDRLRHQYRAHLPGAVDAAATP